MTTKTTPEKLSPEKKQFIQEKSDAFLKINGLVMVSFFDYPDYGNVLEPDGRSVYLVPEHMRNCYHSEAREHGVLLHRS